MLSLATAAVGVGLALASGAYAVARVDALDHRTALVVVAVVLAVGGTAVQMTPLGTADDATAAVAEPPAATGSDAVQRATRTVESTTDGQSNATTGERPNATATSDGQPNATVVGVSAADRVTYRTEAGTERTVRLAGVDAPGVSGADPQRFDGVVTGERGRACLADHGRRGVRALRARLLDNGVTVHRVGDDAGVPTAVLVHDGRSVNRQLVDRGYARATDDRYADAERSARSATLGLWSCGVVEPPRPLHESNGSGLRIAAVHPNPHGDDAEALTEEYVVVENVGRRTVDLSGWYLVIDGTYHFFDGPELRPGAELVIHVGTGRDADGHRYLDAARPLLDDDGGTLKLVDGGSDRVVRLSY